LKSEVSKNTTSLVYPVKNRQARNNASRKVKQVEIIRVIEVINNVTKFNFKDFHTFFTTNETQ
jgi:hypothetical protein